MVQIHCLEQAPPDSLHLPCLGKLSHLLVTVVHECKTVNGRLRV